MELGTTEGLERLRQLLQRCTVRVEAKLSKGTGFFVAPGLIVTCAHVVTDITVGEDLLVHWSPLAPLKCRLIAKLPDPYTEGAFPDVALLTLTTDRPEHPCVFLDRDGDAGARVPLYGWGYTEKNALGDPITPESEGIGKRGSTEDAWLIKLRGAQIVAGLSGAPLLNELSGRICGLIKFTRDQQSDLGGYAIRAAVVLDRFQQVSEFQERYQRTTSEWRTASESLAHAKEVSSYHRDNQRIPRQLPDRPVGGHLFGREKELRALTARLQSGETSAVVGHAGLGKTALAAEAVRAVIGNTDVSLLASPFPDGVVLLDLYRLKGRAEETWNALANALIGGANADIPARERAESACRNRRLLIIFEGAEEADGSDSRAQFNELMSVLDPANQKLILTRDSSQVAPAITVRLVDALDEQAAGELFDQIAGVDIEPAVRKEILALLQGHPLALTWAANLLARGDESPRQLCSEWRQSSLPGFSDPSEARHTLRWLFERSVRRLNSTERQVLAAAGILAHAEFPLAAIIAGLGENSAKSRPALQRLVQLGLLRRSITRDDHWHFTHSLGYQFARQESAADSHLRARLAHWAQAELAKCLGDGERTALLKVLPQISALLRTDDDQTQWFLAKFCLYDGVEWLKKLGQFDLIVQLLNAIDSWFDKLPAGELDKSSWQRERTIGYIAISDVRAAQGDSGPAIECYRSALAIFERLAAADPNNIGAQRDTSVTYEKIGEVHLALGDRDTAIGSYQAALAILERLAAADPHDIEMQRDLATLYNKIGDAQAAPGDSGAAFESYRTALSIRERLASAEPDNVEAQRDLAMSLDSIGDVLAAQGNDDAAIESYQAAVSIFAGWATAEPQNTEWQRDLSVSYDRIGDVRASQGLLAAAIENYQESRAIRERLVALEPHNTQWQRDLSVSHDNLGNAQAAQGTSADAAIESYQAAHAILERLVAVDPHNIQWQRALSLNYGKVATLGEAAYSVEARRAMLQNGLDILNDLRQRGQMRPSDLEMVTAFESAMQLLQG